jgi:hypothetical protein
VDGYPKLFTWVPNPIPYCPTWGHDALKLVEREKLINARLFKYVEFWKQCIEQNATYAMKMSMYVDYWEDILLHLSKPLLVQGCTFLEGFWPSSNWKLNYAKVELPSTTLIVPKGPVIHPYCGPKNLKSVPAYTL